MLNYLTSDEIIREPFLLDAILPRFTSTLLNVLQRYAAAYHTYILPDKRKHIHTYISTLQMLNQIDTLYVSDTTQLQDSGSEEFGDKSGQHGEL